MNSSVLISFATLIEAQASIRCLQAKEISPNCWQIRNKILIVTGMGMLKSSHHLAIAIKEFRPTQVLSLGFAAELNGQAIGQIVEVNEVTRALPNLRSDATSRRIFSECYPKLILKAENSTAKLLTVDVPIHNTILRSRFSKFADLLDLESYSVAWLCHFCKVKCRVIKVISDRAKGGGRKDMLKMAPTLSLKLAKWIMAEISE